MVWKLQKENLSSNEANPSILNLGRNLPMENEFGDNEVLLSAKDLKICCKESNPALKPCFVLLMNDENELKES